MVEQGLHPHPGPTTWDRLWNEARAETEAAFEYCCKYTFARWKAVEQIPGGPKLSSIWEDPYWRVVADANAPRVLTDAQAKLIAQSRTAALERRAARAVIEQAVKDRIATSRIEALKRRAAKMESDNHLNDLHRLQLYLAEIMEQDDATVEDDEAEGAAEQAAEFCAAIAVGADVPIGADSIDLAVACVHDRGGGVWDYLFADEVQHGPSQHQLNAEAVPFYPHQGEAQSQVGNDHPREVQMAMPTQGRPVRTLPRIR